MSDHPSPNDNGSEQQTSTAAGAEHIEGRTQNPANAGLGSQRRRPRFGAEHIPPQLRQAMSSRLLAANFGNMVAVLMQSPAHRDRKLADLSELIVPALLKDQFRIAEVHKKDSGFTAPVGLVLWARVSEEVDARLMQDPDKPARLRPDEWAGGDIFWVIETLGEKRFVTPLLEDLANKVFKDKPVKLRAIDESGNATIKTLGVAQT